MDNVVKPLTKYLRFNRVRIYDAVFILHAKCTVVILVAFSFLISGKQYFGEPIQCLTKEENKDYFNSKCWTLGTYILSPDIQQHRKGSAVAEGVRSGISDKIYLRYYQWVVMMFLLQALVFYFPAFLWKVWEGERLKQLCSDMSAVIIENEAYKKRRDMLVQYFSRNNRDAHCIYVFKYIFCEVLNVIISFINFVVLDVFLNGFWSRYMSALAMIPKYDWDSWDKVTSQIFPKIAKCDIQKYGASGSLEERDGLCMLPLNILNEKIFAFLWPWFIMIAILSIIKIIYRILMICSKTIRLNLLRSHLRSIPATQFRVIMQNMSFGDWFMLYKVSINISPVLLHDIIKELYTGQCQTANGKIPNHECDGSDVV